MIEAEKLRVDDDMGMGGGMKGVEGDLIPFFFFFPRGRCMGDDPGVEEERWKGDHWTRWQSNPVSRLEGGVS